MKSKVQAMTEDFLLTPFFAVAAASSTLGSALAVFFVSLRAAFTFNGVSGFLADCRGFFADHNFTWRSRACWSFLTTSYCSD